MPYLYIFLFFFFNDTATTEIYTLSLHDALPIFVDDPDAGSRHAGGDRHLFHDVDELPLLRVGGVDDLAGDRKSTRLNSSHLVISYAVFCLKKKKTTTYATRSAEPRSRQLERSLD